MGTWATGKYALMISDRSGMAFPYREMVQEWTGSWVHTTEFEKKQPQLLTYYHQADAVAFRTPRPQKKTGIVVTLDLSLWWAVNTLGNRTEAGEWIGTPGSMMPPPTANQQNKKRVIKTALGKVTVTT